MVLRLSSVTKALLLGSALAVGVPLAAAAPEVEQPAPAVVQAPPAIRVVAAERRELVETLTVSGTIVARDEAAVGTDVAGLIVQALKADEGDFVRKGDILAVLDRRSLDTQLAQSDASRAQAEAAAGQVEAQIGDAEVAVRQGEEALRRARELKSKGVSTQAELDNAVNAADSAKARLVVAQRALAASRAQLAVIDAQKENVLLQIDKTNVRAPADGLVLARNATLGGIVSGGGGALFRIAINGEFELAADVAETSLARLAKDMPVAVYLAGLPQPLKGTIRRVSPEIDRQSRLGSIRVTLEESDKARAGNFGRGVVEVARSTAITVPASALIFEGRDAFLQVVSEGTVHTKPVTLGIRDGEAVAVDTGVSEGEDVVARAGTFVADGDNVKPVRDADAGAAAP